jgi:hypothetical protein
MLVFRFQKRQCAQSCVRAILNTSALLLDSLGIWYAIDLSWTLRSFVHDMLQSLGAYSRSPVAIGTIRSYNRRDGCAGPASVVLILSTVV